MYIILDVFARKAGVQPEWNSAMDILGAVHCILDLYWFNRNIEILYNKEICHLQLKKDVDLYICPASFISRVVISRFYNSSSGP